MALVNVRGNVEKVFFDGKGISIAETFQTREGATKTIKYTAWFDEAPGLTVGEFGTFSGLLSTVIEDWKDADGNAKLDNNGNPGRSVKISLNKARYEVGSEPATSAPAAPATPAADVPF